MLCSSIFLSVYNPETPILLELLLLLTFWLKSEEIVIGSDVKRNLSQKGNRLVSINLLITNKVGINRIKVFYQMEIRFIRLGVFMLVKNGGHL